MSKLPAWLKVVFAILLFGALYGGSQVLLHFDKAATGRFGAE